MEELKPCPFCGDDPVIRECMGEYWPECPGCTKHLFSTEAEAVAAWNRRAAVSELRDDNKVYQEMLSTAYSLLYAGKRSVIDRPNWQEATEEWLRNCEERLRARDFPFAEENRRAQ